MHRGPSCRHRDWDEGEVRTVSRYSDEGGLDGGMVKGPGDERHDFSM
jgi:hypothetical protein